MSNNIRGETDSLIQRASLVLTDWLVLNSFHSILLRGTPISRENIAFVKNNSPPSTTKSPLLILKKKPLTRRSRQCALHRNCSLNSGHLEFPPLR